MNFLVGAVREPPLRVDFHGKACGYHKLPVDRNSVLEAYGVCYKFLPLGDSQIPLNPPFSKGDFPCNSL
jgi:hypothetical protein